MTSESLNAIISKCVFIDSRAFPSDREKRDELSSTTICAGDDNLWCEVLQNVAGTRICAATDLLPWAGAAPVCLLGWGGGGGQNVSLLLHEPKLFAPALEKVAQRIRHIFPRVQKMFNKIFLWGRGIIMAMIDR